jgi:hypothetical protein
VGRIDVRLIAASFCPFLQEIRDDERDLYDHEHRQGRQDTAFVAPADVILVEYVGALETSRGLAGTPDSSGGTVKACYQLPMGMSTLNEEMADVRSDVDDVQTQLREDVPEFFAFDVAVGNITYNANTNSVSVTVEPSSRAREQLSDELGGVTVKTDGKLEFEFRLTDPQSESE